ncbi:MAG: hypothetical protein WA208_01380 [Thermoanaerobaculia bacterium]
MREHALVIYEPMTVLTDYLLAGFAFAFALRLWRPNRAWSMAFLFTAAGAITGGSFHAIAPRLTTSAEQQVWLATVLFIGAASCFLLAGLGRGFAVFAVVKFSAYAMWVRLDPSFIVVIADYGTSMLLVGVVHAVRWSRASPWVLGGIAMSALAAVIQASGFALHPHFNHNDLYHVVQIVALWLLYRGGKQGIDGRAVDVTSS